MRYTLDNALKKELLFSVEDDCIYLHINDTVAIPFRNIDEWREFANSMLEMIPEISSDIH